MCIMGAMISCYRQRDGAEGDCFAQRRPADGRAHPGGGGGVQGGLYFFLLKLFYSCFLLPISVFLPFFFSFL